ncbi:eif3I [Symbiodinium necroappetens]|uniref:Serine-threonine kinase receptor-associated protein n=1 Tax=Symbiodinium necroappetens TaxID=1628268 RepID=A0A812PPL4_9DINO|nr:eif3I [Symbiodinium necroappetens]
MLLTTLHSFALVAGRIRQPRGSTLSFSSVESNADVLRPLTLVKFNYDGDFFITCGKDGEVNLIRTETCERVGTYNPPGEKAGAVFAVDVTMDSTYVVTANADGKLCFYTFKGEHVSAINHGGVLKYVEWNLKPGDQNMVCTCNDKFKSQSEGLVPNRIMIWSFDPPRRILSIDDQLPMKATKVKWGAFDETLVSIFEEGTVIVWDSSDGRQLQLIQAHQMAVTSSLAVQRFRSGSGQLF